MRKFGKLNIYDNKPTIIAEAGVNHNCKLSLAKKYVDLAKDGGADAIKFQTYKADTLVSKISPAYWDLKKEKTSSQYKLFKKYDKFNKSEYSALHQYCKKKKIEFMTTVFDYQEIDNYDDLISVYKISSSDITNVPLLKKIGSKKKNVCLSTGASTINEIKFALNNLNLNKNKVCIMHCVLNYPTEPQHANLKFIKELKRIFPDFIIGYSDHVKADEDLNCIKLAYDYGAKIIEKHFTHNKKLKGNDHYHAMDKHDMYKLYNYYKYIDLLNKSSKNKIINESNSRKYARRSIYTSKDIFIGDTFTPINLTTKRPNTGLCASKWNKIIGKKSKKNLISGSLIKKDYF